MARPTLAINKFLLIIIFLLLALLIPIPNIKTVELCPMIYPSKCLPPKKILTWQPPLFIQLYNRLTTLEPTQPAVSVPGKAPNDEINADYGCPETGWVNCMPILTEEAQKSCSPEAIARFKKNCPNFKGVTQ